ncbi:hypothetical protein F0U44_06940 [Nocardioides humilatus]|uniref:Uncharacterized protein n=1 Tax=Nocardioides humilatus TaxID=2607660 RepID=A0A5B1LK36_9ACTN|nr:hypothetical protein [Nocardioides humilatus]KAA1420160.1 hypothetical protein F0U44_06940 [Nocardioides humilatus]
MTSTDEDLGQVPAEGDPARERGPRLAPRIAAWVLIVSWVSSAFAVVAFGERESSVDDLMAAIAGGEVTEVTVAGGLEDHWRGSAPIQLRWREHGIRYVAEAIQVRGPKAHHRPTSSGGWVEVRSDQRPRFRGEVEDFLTRGGGEIDIDRSEDWHRSGHFTGSWGWEIPEWLSGWGLLNWVLTLVVLVSGAQPWRATRWAWFWLIGAGWMIVAPLYLLIGGPTGLARPVAPSNRLTGGWAFLISLLVGSVAQTIAINTFH